MSRHNGKKYKTITKTSIGSTNRDLQDMVEKQCLYAISAGRSVHYDLNLIF